MTARRAMVTGGGTGIGAQICLRLALDGATVAVADVDLTAAQSTATAVLESGGEAHAVHVDVRDQASVDSAVAQAAGALGGLDVLVNNAGVTSFVRVEDMDETEWDRILDVNLKGTYLMCRAAIPHLVASGRGAVVNMSSILGRNGAAYSAHYCASKFGVIGFSESLAAELGSRQVTVNVVSPGVVESPMQDAIRQEMAAASVGGSTAAEVGAWMASLSPLGRSQTPQDVAEMVAFLVGDRARNLTAGVYPVDGGIVAR